MFLRSSHLIKAALLGALGGSSLFGDYHSSIGERYTGVEARRIEGPGGNQIGMRSCPADVYRAFLNNDRAQKTAIVTIRSHGAQPHNNDIEFNPHDNGYNYNRPDQYTLENNNRGGASNAKQFFADHSLKLRCVDGEYVFFGRGFRRSWNSPAWHGPVNEMFIYLDQTEASNTLTKDQWAGFLSPFPSGRPWLSHFKLKQDVESLSPEELLKNLVKNLEELKLLGSDSGDGAGEDSEKKQQSPKTTSEDILKNDPTKMLEDGMKNMEDAMKKLEELSKQPLGSSGDGEAAAEAAAGPAGLLLPSGGLDSEGVASSEKREKGASSKQQKLLSSKEIIEKEELEWARNLSKYGHPLGPRSLSTDVNLLGPDLEELHFFLRKSKNRFSRRKIDEGGAKTLLEEDVGGAKKTDVNLMEKLLMDEEIWSQEAFLAYFERVGGQVEEIILS